MLKLNRISICVNLSINYVKAINPSNNLLKVHIK